MNPRVHLMISIGNLVLLLIASTGVGEGQETRSPGASAFDSDVAGTKGLRVASRESRENSKSPPILGQNQLDNSPGSRRDTLWQQATEHARREEWRQAVTAAEGALQIHRQFFAEQRSVTCRILDAISIWQTKQRAFDPALAAAKEVHAIKLQILGAEHWETNDSRLNIEFIQRLSQLNDEEWREFEIADRFSREAAELQAAGKTKEAFDRINRVLPIYTRLFGREAPLTLTCLSNLLVCRLELGEYAQAEPLVRETIENIPRVKGLLHPDSIHSLQLLARFNEYVADFKNAEEVARKVLEIHSAVAGPHHPETIKSSVNLAKILIDRENFNEAERLLVQSLQLQKEQAGEDSPDTAQTKKTLGTLYCKQRKLAEAEALLVQSLETFRKTIGDQHLATASARNALGRLWIDMGRFQEADQQLRASYSVCVTNFGEKHPVTAKVLDNLALLYESTSNIGVARQIRHHCLTVSEQTYGEFNPHTAEALENVARSYLSMNDFGLAEPYLLRARQIHRQLVGEDHPRTAKVTGQLAYIYLAIGDSKRAEPLFLEALNSFEKSGHNLSPDAMRVRSRLALLYQSEGKFDAAEREYREALNVAASVRTFEDPRAPLQVRVGLAQTLVSLGKCIEACSIIDEALNGYQQILHANNPEWIDALGVAGTAYLGAGDREKAEQLLARGLEIAHRELQMPDAFSSERQQLVQMMILRSMLDLYLSLPHDPSSAAKLYPHVLAWKGTVAARQWHQRQQRNAQTAPITAELQQVSRRLATLALSVPEAENREDWIKQIFELNMRKELLEEQRAAIHAQTSSALPPLVTIADVQSAIPEGAALIDFLVFPRTSFRSDGEKLEMVRTAHCIAFVLRSDRAVERVDLGELDPIGTAVIKWRQTRGFRPDKGKQDWAATLGELVWQPLQAHVADCRTILISPDGPLTQFAWNVLPGRQPDTYLIEDHAIGIVPAPQLLPIIHRIGRTGAEGSNSESLLLVGDVDYNASPTGQVGEANDETERLRRFNFSPLKGTAAEIRALKSHFESHYPNGLLTTLEKGAATEQAFWNEASQHRWIHVATHGFFAPPGVKSAIATQARMDPSASQRDGVSVFHVGYLNGIVLAGANMGATGDGDDGILTAQELATMDLRGVEVAVLSGCETGLGEAQTGEGAFGMQRALQIAGARTTVGSLWTVPDEKTNQLMQRFYANLWERKLSKLEALREAQLWMLNSGGTKRLSPHYWAAFTLSGEWE